MKAKVPVTSFLNHEQMKALIEYTKQMAEEHVEEKTDELFNRYLMLTAVTLSESYGFGKNRLCRFFDKFGELVQIVAPEDDVFWAHIERRLEQLGVDKYFKSRKEKNDDRLRP